MKSSLSISQYASGLREQLGITPNSVVGDIVELVKMGGYDYIEESFGEDFSGFSQYIGMGRFIIGFNKNRDFGLPFKRYTIAHELGHVSIPDHQKCLFSEQQLHRSYEKKQCDIVEIEAENFAAHFLAPSNACYDLIPNLDLVPDNVRYLADHFIISLYAASLRIRALTDSCCTIIVCNDKGKTEYERHSSLLESIIGYKIPYVYNTKIHEYSLLSDFIKKKTVTETCESQLNYWYPDLPNDFPITESVIDLGYNGKYMALLQINELEMENYISTLEDDELGFRRDL